MRFDQVPGRATQLETGIEPDAPSSRREPRDVAGGVENLRSLFDHFSEETGKQPLDLVRASREQHVNVP